MTTPGMNTGELMARLERHYIKPSDPLPGGVFIPECGWNGGGTGRRCDALYVGFTGTSGRILVGHEVKVSRADWRHELDQLHKAEVWADQCHEWWVVAPSIDIVPPAELPAGWGLMVPGKSKVRLDKVVRAVTHHDRKPSWAAVRSVMSRQDTLRAEAILRFQREIQDQVRAGVDAEMTRRAQARRDRGHVGLGDLSDTDRQRLEAAAAIEDKHGLKLRMWGRDEDSVTPAQFALAVKIAKQIERFPQRWAAANFLKYLGDVERAARDLDRMLADLDKGLTMGGAA